MTSERWQLIERLFADASALPAVERAAFVENACAGDAALRDEILELLAQDARADDAPLARIVQDAAAALVQGPAQDEWTGRNIGPWVVLREIGRGGMGRVLLARRADGAFDRQVAIKLSLSGMASAALAARLERERKILAALDHRSIARLLDGGTTSEGIPFVVMEYVEGAPIDRHCAERQVGLRERIELLLEVCEAVEHAHRALVVHRDIKPANILVTADGRPKLLDFGIAALLDAEGESPRARATGTLIRALTPEYASPEQVRGEPITTATDVYSLGIVLYELLTGARPFDFANESPAEIERVLTTREPVRPSAVIEPARARRLRGDLDNIVLKAMRKEPQRRYASVAELADDLRRHLEGRPVQARPNTAGYRLSRFARRHRVSLGFAGAALVALAGAVSYHVVTLTAERDRALLEAQKSTRIASFLEEMLAASIPKDRDVRTITALELLDAGAARIDEELAEEPAVRVEMQNTMGNVYRKLGQYETAEAQLRKALAAAESEIGPESTETAHVLISLGALLYSVSRDEEAIEITGRALDVLRRSKTSDPKIATAAYNLALLHRRAGRLEEAMALGQEVLAQRRLMFEPGDARILSAMRLIGGVHQRRKELTEARAIFSAILEATRRRVGEKHLETALALADLADVESDLVNYEGAAELFERTLAIRREILAPDHPSLGATLLALCRTRHALGDVEAALAQCTEAYELWSATLPATHQHMLVLRDLRGTLLADLGRFDEARAESRAAFELSLERFGDAHPRTVYGETNYGLLLANIGAFAEAEPILMSAVSRWERLPPGSEVDAAVTRGALGAILVDLGRTDEARAILETTREFLLEKLGPDHLAVAARSFHLARALEEQGALDEARRLHEETLAIREREQGKGLITADSLHEFGAFLLRRGELAAAREKLLAALAMRRELHGRPHVETGETLAALAELALAEGDAEEAGRLAEQGVDAAREGHAAPFRLARTQITLARVLARRGDPAAPDLASEALGVLRAVYPPEARARRDAEAVLASLVRR